ncbi:DUF2958 domain-containing protein, partial [Pseudomonas aeruginosa]
MRPIGLQSIVFIWCSTFLCLY